MNRCTGYYTESTDGRDFDCDIGDGRTCEECEYGPESTPSHTPMGTQDQDRVRNFRDHVKAIWPTPVPSDSVRFVYQELGELDSVLMRLGLAQGAYLRNTDNPADLQAAMMLELGQTYLMLLTLANGLGTCLSCALTTALDHQSGKLLDKLIAQVNAGEPLSSSQKLLLDQLRTDILDQLRTDQLDQLDC